MLHVETFPPKNTFILGRKRLGRKCIGGGKRLSPPGAMHNKMHLNLHKSFAQHTPFWNFQNCRSSPWCFAEVTWFFQALPKIERNARKICQKRKVVKSNWKNIPILADLPLCKSKTLYDSFKCLARRRQLFQSKEIDYMY